MSVEPLDLFEPASAPRSDAAEALARAARERILILDGAMGTQIQDLALDEGHFRGERFVGCECHLKGDNDLLTLTQPQAIEDIHFAYAMAGADILETNTFSSTSIAQADYGMQEVVYELNRDGARLARRAALKAAAHRRQAPLRRRGARADQPHRFDLARRQQSRLPRGHLRRVARSLRRADRRPDRRRRRHHPDRDDFRHAQRQGGGVRLRGDFRRARAAPAPDDLRHDHRPLGAHAVGADADRVLAFAAPRPPVHHRPQLRARRERDARTSRGDLGRRRDLRLRLSQRRPAQRIRPLRRNPGADGGRDRPASRATASSTSSAAAAARRPRISARSPKPCAASNRASPRKWRR